MTTDQLRTGSQLESEIKAAKQILSNWEAATSWGNGNTVMVTVKHGNGKAQTGTCFTNSDFEPIRSLSIHTWTERIKELEERFAAL